MRTRELAEVPPALDRVRRQLEQWRRQQSGRKRLPPELWARAVALAGKHGINRTARTLGLKYESLKKHVAATGGEVSPARSGDRRFVELLPRLPAGPSLTCIIALDDGQGLPLRMEVQGLAITDLVSLAQGLRSRRP